MHADKRFLYCLSLPHDSAYFTVMKSDLDIALLPINILQIEIIYLKLSTGVHVDLLTHPEFSYSKAFLVQTLAA